MLSLVARSDIGYLQDQCEDDDRAQRPDALSYEAGGSEEMPTWAGVGAAEFGLSGKATNKEINTLYRELKHPQTGEQLGTAPRQYTSAQERLEKALAAEPFASPERVAELRYDILGKGTPQARNYWDACLSPHKSWSVLEAAYRLAGDHESAEKIWQCLEVGIQAMAQYMSEEGRHLSRKGYHGRKTGSFSSGQYIETGGFCIAMFRHSTSRNNDPQIHIHAAILNRVMCADGVYRALDGQALLDMRAAAGAVAERAMEEHARKTLGLSFGLRPGAVARHIEGIEPEVEDHFSTRRHDINPVLAELAAAYEAKHGVSPNPKTMAALAQQATLSTRRKKDQSMSAEQLLERWEQSLENKFGYGLGRVLEKLKQGTTDALPFDPDEVVRLAIADVQASKSTWTRYDLVPHLNRRLPDCLGGLTGKQIETVLEGLVDMALVSAEVTTLQPPSMFEVPVELRRADGKSIYEPHDSGRYATVEQLASEDRIRKVTKSKGAPSLPKDKAAGLVRETGCGEDQGRALRGILTSGLRLECLRAPAGSGKTFTVGKLAELWPKIAGQTVFGLALGENAVQELVDKGITQAANIARFLDAWERDEEPLEPMDLHNDARIAMNAGEAAYNKALKHLPRSRAREIADERQREVGAKCTERNRVTIDINAARMERNAEKKALRPKRGQLVVIDEASMVDNAHLTKVINICLGAGCKVVMVGDDRQLSAIGAGGLFSMLARETRTYELEEVRRFDEAWEAEASLLIREGDYRGIVEYDRRGRIAGGNELQMRAAAVDNYVADLGSGLSSLLLVSTEEEASDVARQVRAELCRLGKVQERGGIPLGDGNFVGVGDLIQTRRNSRRIRDLDGRHVVNRDVYRVVMVKSDGSLLVQRVLENDNYGPDLVLKKRYAKEHVRLAYASTVHAAQGRTVDTSHSIITQSSGPEALYVSGTRGRQTNHFYAVCEVEADSDRDEIKEHALAVMRSALTPGHKDLSALEVQRQEFDAAVSLGRLGPIWGDVVSRISETKYEFLLGQHLTRSQLQAVKESEARGALFGLMRAAERAGRDIAALIPAVIAQRELGTAESVAQVLHWRLSKAVGELHEIADGTVPSFTAQTPEVDSPIGAYAIQLAAAMDRRVAQLGELAAEERPEWTECLGEAPTDPAERLLFTQRLAAIAAYRDQYGYSAPRDPIGPLPSRSAVDQYFAWNRANRAIGRTDVVDIAGAGNAKLHKLIADYQREVEWAPPHVDEEMKSAYTVIRKRETELRKLVIKQLAHPDDERARLIKNRQIVLDALREEAKSFEVMADARQQWWDETAPARQLAEAAIDELTKRIDDYEPPRIEVPANPHASQEERMACTRKALAVLKERKEAAKRIEEERRKRLRDDFRRPPSATFMVRGNSWSRSAGQGLERTR